MNIKIYISLSLLVIGSASCKKDNYDAPSAELTGRIVYQGEAIPVENGQVNFELWEPGWGASGAINVTVAQDGSYSTLLFNGNYKLTIPQGQGPFMWKKNAQGKPDTIEVTMNGGQTLDIEVTPYYMIRNPQFTASSGSVNASCSLEQIIKDANAKSVERVTLYINKTQFVSGNVNSNIASANGNLTDLSNISLSVTVPQMIPSQDYVFARIGVKIAGVEDLLFSPVQRVEL